MNRGGSHTPVCLLDATHPEKPCSFFLRIAQTRGATAVKQVGVLHRRQDCEEALYASGFRIFRCHAAAEAQRGQPDVECYRKAGCGLRSRTARAKLAQRIPRPKIAPRCVLTPPVAASIARSASTPISRNLSMSEPAAPATAS